MQTGVAIRREKFDDMIAASTQYQSNQTDR